MTKIYHFTIHGKPQAQSRPRFANTESGLRCYNALGKQKKRDRLIIMSQIRSNGLLTRLDGPIAVEMTFHMGNTKKSLRDDLNGLPKPTKPDIDNLAKFYLDILSNLIYTDDRLVTSLKCRKIFSEEKKVEITIKYDKRRTER